MYCDGTCDPLRVQLDVIVMKLISVKKSCGFDYRWSQGSTHMVGLSLVNFGLLSSDVNRTLPTVVWPNIREVYQVGVFIYN